MPSKNMGSSALTGEAIPLLSLATDKKRFTESLHSRRSNGTFEPSSERGLTRRKRMEEERVGQKPDPTRR